MKDRRKSERRRYKRRDLYQEKRYPGERSGSMDRRSGIDRRIYNNQSF